MNSHQSLEQRNFDVIVIGGGAAGCATTYNLAIKGANVALLEKYNTLACMNTHGIKVFDGTDYCDVIVGVT